MNITPAVAKSVSIVTVDMKSFAGAVLQGGHGVVPPLNQEFDRLGKIFRRMMEDALQAELLENTGVATIAGTSFGKCGEGYLRFSYANSREAIGEAIERIGKLLGNLPARDVAR